MVTEKLAKQGTYSIEIAGPFGSEEIAALVEASLISALRHTPSVALLNEIGGMSKGNFRSIGVPTQFANRGVASPLKRNDLKRISGGRPILLVKLTDRLTKDKRIGVDLANPPTDSEIHERMVRWWQLNSRMPNWKLNRKLIPTVLIAVSGTPKHRIVVASLPIDHEAPLPWEAAKGGLSRVPVLASEGLDFGEIRGCRIDSAIAKFGGVKAQFFNIV